MATAILPWVLHSVQQKVENNNVERKNIGKKFRSKNVEKKKSNTQLEWWHDKMRHYMELHPNIANLIEKNWIKWTARAIDNNGSDWRWWRRTIILKEWWANFQFWNSTFFGGTVLNWKNSIVLDPYTSVVCTVLIIQCILIRIDECFHSI